MTTSLTDPFKDWERTAAAAKRMVDDLISRLPDEVRPEAHRIGYELRKRCQDGETTLGEYFKSAHLIILYLETIRDDCAAEGFDYERQVEKTYLHELGHHLGLGEDEVARLGV